MADLVYVQCGFGFKIEEKTVNLCNCYLFRIYVVRLIISRDLGYFILDKVTIDNYRVQQFL